MFLKAIPVTVFVLPHLKSLIMGDSRIESLICLEPATQGLIPVVRALER